MRALFCLGSLFGGVDTLLGFALQDFGQEFPTVAKEVIVHIVEDVTISDVIAGGIGVGEKGLELFGKQGFGVIAGSDVVHRTSVSEGSPQYNIPPPKFYAPKCCRATDVHFLCGILIGWQIAELLHQPK
jgi:hypothetical protein